MERSYVLPVAAVIEAMWSFPQSVLLEATFPSLPGISHEACIARIILGQGEAPACLIVASRTGAVLSLAQEAYQALERCGDVCWHVMGTPASLRAPPPQALPSSRGERASSARPPSLRVSLTEASLRHLPSLSQRVLRLVDGKRSVEHIAWLLGKSPQEVASVLAALPDVVL